MQKIYFNDIKYNNEEILNSENPKLRRNRYDNYNTLIPHNDSAKHNYDNVKKIKIKEKENNIINYIKKIVAIIVAFIGGGVGIVSAHQSDLKADFVYIETSHDSIFYEIELSEYVPNIKVILKNDFTLREQYLKDDGEYGYFDRLKENMYYTLIISHDNIKLASRQIKTLEESIYVKDERMN